MSYTARCTCRWEQEASNKRLAEIMAQIHEESAGKLRPHAHETSVHREDE